MPFTFSHPAAVLPLSYLPKRWISMTGLIIGSIAPDFEYFIRMRVYSSYSHTFAGIFWFDLPLAIILAFLFHLIVRDSLIDNLPMFLTNRLVIFKNFNWTKHFKENILVVIVSILIGVFTHLFWDSFTHERGQFVHEISGLKHIFFIAGYSIPTYKILQHFSTIIGGVIIIYALFQLPINGNYERNKSIFRFWLIVCIVVIIYFIFRVFIEHRILGNINEPNYVNIIVTLITGGLLGLIISSSTRYKRFSLILSASVLIIFLDLSPMIYQMLFGNGGTYVKYYNYKISGNSMLNVMNVEFNYQNKKEDKPFITSIHPDDNNSGFTYIQLYNENSKEYINIRVRTNQEFKKGTEIVFYGISDSQNYHDCRLINLEYDFITREMIKKKFERLVIDKLKLRNITPQ